MNKTWALVLLAAIAYVGLTLCAVADDSKIKYCKNYETGEIIVIEKGYPCPSPTVEI